MQPNVLIVDDEKHTRDGLRASLEDEFEVYIAADAAEATAVLEVESMDVMVTDLRLGGEDGMSLIERALAMPQPPICIMMTAYGSVDTAVEAMKKGAYDFITKPINIDKLEILIKRALRSRDVESENASLRRQVEHRYGLEKIIGESFAIQEVLDTIRQVAPSRATVLIQGESGTGKELVAQAVHNLSNRSKAKFIPVHCAALAPQLLESELFGHEKGAFTGATERRIGRFEQADGGTLFLDEIGEIDTSTQVKILRVLGERSFERVGGSKTVQVDVRLVAATNRNLAEMVKEGAFRDDLYFRLNVVQITLPPLRERTEDIPLLVKSFLAQFAAENEKGNMRLTTEAMSALTSYHWPGNVRELRTAIEHGVVMSNNDKVTLRDLPQAIRTAAAEIRDTCGSGSLKDAMAGGGSDERFNLQESERRLIIRALDECGGNRTEAAKRLGISRRTLHRRLKELKLEEQ